MFHQRSVPIVKCQDLLFLTFSPFYFMGSQYPHITQNKMSVRTATSEVGAPPEYKFVEEDQPRWGEPARQMKELKKRGENISICFQTCSHRHSYGCSC